MSVPIAEFIAKPLAMVYDLTPDRITVWAFVSWFLIIVLSVVLSKAFKRINQLDRDLDSMLFLNAVISNERDIDLPQTREALRQEIAKRYFRDKNHKVKWPGR